MPGKLLLGLVGCGHIGRIMALQTRITPGISITACCDNSREKAEAFAHKYKIDQTFTNYQRLIENDRIDAVYLAVPYNLLFEMEKTAIFAGIDIFSEKPFTRT